MTSLFGYVALLITKDPGKAQTWAAGEGRITAKPDEILGGQLVERVAKVMDFLLSANDAVPAQRERVMQNESKPSRGYWFAQFGLAFGFIAAGIKIALVLKAEALPFLLLIGMVAFGTLYYVRLRWRGIKKKSTGHGGPWVGFAGALIFAFGALSGVYDLFKPGWSWADVILIVLSSAVAVWSFRLGLKERQTLHNTTNPVDKNS